MINIGRKKKVPKIYVCHKCGKARRTEPKRLKWLQCCCIGQTTFEYETIGRSVEEAKEILTNVNNNAILNTVTGRTDFLCLNLAVSRVE